MKLECLFTSPDYASIFEPKCSHCMNWSFDAKHSLLHSLPPEGFPPDEVPSTGKLPPLVLDYECLLAAARKCHDEIVSGKWMTKEGEAFLSYHCFKTDIISNIIENAMNCQLYTYLSNHREGSERAFMAIARDKADNPQLYERYSLPVSWYSWDPLDIFHDTPVGSTLYLHSTVPSHYLGTGL